jgi:glycosyltransferase involved in cell wall biosynthesis
MKRVLHILYSLERSGMEVMLLNSSNEWGRHGFACDVLATAPAIGPLDHEMRTVGYQVHHLPFRGWFSLFPRIDFTRKFFRLCRSGYDVVHIHTEAGAPLFALIAWLAGVRRIALTPHNTFRFQGLLRWRKLCERAFVRALDGRYGIISKGVRECELMRFHNNGASISNWIDTAYFRPPNADERRHARMALGISPDQFAIVSVGNCNSVKNHTAILHALPLLPSGLRPVYLHVGREETSYPERKAAVALGIQDRVRFLGSQPDMLPFLWAADVFAMPSLHEGLGVAAIEAVAAGVALVCAQTEGLSDVAASTSYTTLTLTTAESVAEGLAYAASLPMGELRNRALADSRSIRERFSIRDGVQSIVTALYNDPLPSPSAEDEIWGAHEDCA